MKILGLYSKSKDEYLYVGKVYDSSSKIFRLFSGWDEKSLITSISHIDDKYVIKNLYFDIFSKINVCNSKTEISADNVEPIYGNINIFNILVNTLKLRNEYFKKWVKRLEVKIAKENFRMIFNPNKIIYGELLYANNNLFEFSIHYLNDEYGKIFKTSKHSIKINRLFMTLWFKKIQNKK